MKILFLFLFFFSAPTFADEPCSAIKSAQDILNCAIDNHPDVQISKASLTRDEALKKVAKQLPNPELDGSVLSGQPGTPEGVFVDVGISQSIELGGKRKNRIKQAKAMGAMSSAQLLESKELTALNMALALHRLRQI